MTRLRWLALVAAFLPVFAALSASPGQAGDVSTQSLVRFFQGKSRGLPSPGIDFQFTAGYANIKTAAPESSGRYAITAINATKVAPDIYRLDLSLEKPLPRDVLTNEQPYFFTERRTYYFWYQNGERIIFKVGDKKVMRHLGRKDVLRVDIHSPDTYSVDRETMLKNISFEDGPATIHLQLKFK